MLKSLTAIVLILGGVEVPPVQPTPTPVAAPEGVEEETEEIWESDECAEVRLQVQDASSGKSVWRAWVNYPPAGTTHMDSPETVELAPIGHTDRLGTMVLPLDGGAPWALVTKTGYKSVKINVPCSTTPTAIALVLFEVAPEFKDSASAGGDTHRKMNGQTLETMAGAPRNIFQAVQTLPSVARPTLEETLLASVFGYGDIAMRGSRPGESKAYLDGIELPYFYHYLALSSVVPAEMLEFVDLVPGGSGPQFGRLTGGVIDARSKAGLNDPDEKWHGRASLTLFEGNGIVRGPVGNGTLSVSERFSLMDLIAAANGGTVADGLPVWGYNDFQAIYRQPLGEKHEVTALVFGAWDDISFADRPTQVRTEFYRAGASWRTNYGDIQTRMSATYGYDGAFIKIREPGLGLQLDSKRGTHDIRLATDAEFKIHRFLPAVRVGGEVHGLRPEITVALDWQEQEFLLVDRTYYDYGIWGAAWAEAELRPHPSVVILPGIRWDYDTMVGRGWLDPRLTARWFIDGKTTVSAAGGLYHRPQPFALAFVEQENFELTEAIQASAGVSRSFGPLFGGEVVADVRGYYASFKDQIHGTDWLPTFEGDILGDGESYGGEVYLTFAFPSDGIQASIGYSLSETIWMNQGTRDPVTGDDQFLNSDLDSTHGVTLVMNYALPKNWVIGGRMRYYTGYPYTTFDADVYIPDVGGYVGVGESPWDGRAPAYFQTDIRITKKWRVEQRIGIETFFDLQNAFFRTNVDRLSAGGRPTQPEPATALPFLPSLGVSGTF